jgi:F0F1-type ATP synthase assembly protein I
LALELPFVLVCAVVLGGAAGYFLDRWLNTAPLLLILLGLLGFVGGLREMMRRIRMIEKK